MELLQHASQATPQTVEGVVWLYMAGCIERDLIPEHSDRALAHVQQGVLPTCADVREWFSDFFNILSDKGHDIENAQQMEHYFRRTHRVALPHNTPTYLARVEDARDNPLVIPIDGEPVDALPHSVVNIHRYPLRKDTVVFVHAGIVAEIAPAEYWI